MTTRMMLKSVVIIATLGLLGGAARADLISIDFNMSDAPSPGSTASGTVTDLNGDESLPGQVGLWNELLVGEVGSGLVQTSITNKYTSGLLRDGSGALSSVLFTLNTNNASHFAFVDPDISLNVLHHDMVGFNTNTLQEVALDWQLSGLEPNTAYRLKMFGQQSGNPAVARNYGKFIATGATSDSAFCAWHHNYVDLWVKSTAEGKISGAMMMPLGAAIVSWSGMQIEWNVAQAPVTSIAFGHMGDPTPGTPPSGTVTDVNGHDSFPGQMGAWNELLLGDDGEQPGNAAWTVTDRTIVGVLDGDGNATTVNFTLKAGIGYFVYSQALYEPLQTALHRNTMWSHPTYPLQNWQIDGLEASTEYTLRLFGWQNNAGAQFFSAFSATGDGAPVTGTNTLSQNYTDLVVTSTVSGQITGERYSVDIGAWTGLQIQGTQPFLLARDLISIDFEIANTAHQPGTASGLITDSNGDTSWNQAGVWNSLISGTSNGGTWQPHSQQPSISNMLDGAGDATTVDFQFNTGAGAINTYSVSTFPVLHGCAFILSNSGAQEASWTLTGLQPNTWHTMRMFGFENTAPYYFATFEASGMETETGSTSSSTNYVDLTVRSTATGEITGKLVKPVLNGTGSAAGAAWSGMQILKGDTWVPTWVSPGTIFLVQ